MIAHEFKLATKSIYNWLNQGRIGFSLNDLPEHGVRQRRNVDQRSKYNQSLGRSIEPRPMMINQRKRIGDFELDTVVGPRGHSKAVLLTLIDRKSRFLWAYRLKDRTTATVNEALTKFLTTFNGPVHSFTVDRGTEFSGLVSLESQYGIKTYYCHAYTPAERGSNERFNRNLADCKINPNKSDSFQWPLINRFKCCYDLINCYMVKVGLFEKNQHNHRLKDSLATYIYK